MTLSQNIKAPKATPGIQHLGGQAYLYRPPGSSAVKRPLLVLLHGAGMSARSMIDGTRFEADRCSCLLIAVQSGGATWDTIGLARRAAGTGRLAIDRLFGSDTDRVEQAISTTMKAGDINRNAVILVGFSDGASYALSLGLANPSLVRGVVAIAPGFHIEPAAINPRQRLFIAHSPQDRILSFERTGDSIVAPLRRAGFDLRFHPFDGGHRIDRRALAQGVDFVLGRSGAGNNRRSYVEPLRHDPLVRVARRELHQGAVQSGA